MAHSILPTARIARDPLARAELFEEIGRGAHSAVVRGLWDGREVAIKRARRAGTELEQIGKRFVREAQMLARARHAGLVQVFEVGQDAFGCPYMVMELIKGKTLAEQLAKQGLMDAAAVVDMAQAILSALGEVHRRGLVHRDLKPANLMLREDGRPVIIDFGLAAAGQTELARERNEAVGTFLYSPPEQTGMLHRVVDARSDLYSLGVILYECLAGRPPFMTTDVAELLRMHAVEPPPPLAPLCPNAPPALCAIVHKLLAKDPDGRYSTAASVRADLQRITELSKRAQPALGLHDSDPDLVALPLVQRESALQTLISGMSGARFGQGRVVLVRGSRGLGKSRLVSEALRHAYADNALVLRGACMSGTPIRFGALRQALSGWLRKGIGTEREEQLRAAAGASTAYLGSVFPELQKALGATPSDAAVQDNAPELYNEAVARLFLDLATKADALVLALDDLQWIDPGTAGVLERLVPQLPGSHLTLVCALTELTPQLGKLLEHHPVATTELALLEEHAVRSLIAAYLGTVDPDAELVRQLGQRSQGNPRVLVEYLREALETDLLIPAWGGWAVDRKRLAALRLPDSLDGLTLHRLDALPHTVRLLLRKAAFLGHAFQVDTLALFSDLSADTVRRVLAQVVAQGFLSEEEAGSHHFHHDVVLRTLAGELSADGRVAAHRQVADLLDQQTSQTDYAFLAQRAHHHVAGVDAARAVAAHKACVAVASVALQSQAALDSRTWFLRGVELGERYGLEPEAELYQGLAEAWMAEGNIPEGIACFDRAIALCRDDIDRAWLRARVAMAHFASTQDTKETGRYVEQALRDLGEPLPKSKVVAICKALCFGLAFFVRERFGWGYQGPIAARKARVHWKVMEVATGWAMMTEQIPIMLYLTFLAPFVGQGVGPSRELACSYSGFATMLSLLGLPRPWSQHFIQRAYAIADRGRDPVGYARVRMAHAMTLAYQGRVVQAEQVYEDLVRNDSGWLETSLLIMVHMEYAMLWAVRGYTQRGLAILELCLRRIGARPDESDKRLESVTPLLCSLYALEGRHGEMGSKVLRVLDGLDEPGENRFKFAAAWATQMAYRVTTNDIGPALAHACDQLERAAFNPRGAPWQLGMLFMNQSYARYALYCAAKPEEKAARLAKFAETIPPTRLACTHPLVAPHVPIFEAKLLNENGDTEGALAALARADDLAHRHNSPIALFEIHCERARVFRKGDEEAAIFEAELALFLAERQAWPYRVQRLREEFGVGRSNTVHTVAQRGPAFATTSGNHASSSTQLPSPRRGRDAVVEVSLAIADEIDPAAQAQAAVSRLVQLLGAERGCLFLAEDDGKTLKRIAACNARGEPLAADERVAQTLVERVFASGSPLVLTGTEQGVAIASESAVAQNLRSIICAPLRMRERVLGVVYLDSRVACGVFTTTDLDVLLAVANQIAISHYARRNALREVERAQLERDLQTSAVVQSLLLPSRFEASTPHFELAALFRPMGHAGGDFWHYDVSANGMLRVWIGDVTGHGVGAAMVGAAVSGCYRTLRDARYDLTTEEMLAEIDRTLGEICQGAYRLPLGVLELSPDGEARYLSAAAPPLLVWDPEFGLSLMQCGGTPLGSDSLVVKTKTFPMRPQQRFLAISDGVLEMRRADGRDLGIRQLSRLFSAGATDDAVTMRNRLGRELDALRGAATVTDDLTLVTIATRT